MSHVDSQEDKRVGVTKNCGEKRGKRSQEEGTTPSAENTPTPIKQPVCRREEEEAEGAKDVELLDAELLDGCQKVTDRGQ